MEDILQRVFAIILSVVVFFLLPLYMAFEKKDDIAYSMALRITSSFVDNVTNKGYISKEMYLDFISDLAVTGNSYDVKMQHKAKKYYPVIYAKIGDTQKEYDYSRYLALYNEYLEKGQVAIDGITYKKDTTKTLSLNYKTAEILYTEEQILGTVEGTLNVIGRTYTDKDDNNIIYYPMNKGDEFTVIVKNTNTTIASILFNTLTMGINEGENTKVYLNYGGYVQNESYRKTTLIGESTDVTDTHISDEDTVSKVKCSVVLKPEHVIGTFYGDVDENGIINDLDKDLLDKYLNSNTDPNNVIVLSEKAKSNADINIDNGLDANDLLSLNRYVSGINKELVRRISNSRIKYTYYLVFNEPVRLKSGANANIAISIKNTNVNNNITSNGTIDTLEKYNNNSKIWKLTTNVQTNGDFIQSISIKDGYFEAIANTSKTNTVSNTLKVRFYKN